MITNEDDVMYLSISINVEGKREKIIETFDIKIDIWDALVDIRDEKFPDLDIDEFGDEFIKNKTDEEICDFICDIIMWTAYFSDLTEICYSHLDKIISKNVNIRNCYIFKVSSFRWMRKIFENQGILIFEENHPFDNPHWRDQPA